MKDNYSPYINVFYLVVFLRHREIFSKSEYSKPFFSIPIYTRRRFNLGLPEGNCYFLLIKKQTKKNTFQLKKGILYNAALLTVLECLNIYEERRYLKN